MLSGTEGHRLRFTLGIALLAVCLMLPACTRFGPKRVPVDRFNYNEAIGQSQKEQMLLNLVRLRYRDVPVFISVSSVLTQYSYTGSVGTGGSAVLGDQLGTASNVGGNANLGYTERPTVTYTPLSGSEWARRLFSPIPAELVFAASQSGMPTDLLMLIGLQRMNLVENASFGAVPSSDDLERLREFRRVLEVMKELGRRGALEVYRDEVGSPPRHRFVIEVNPESDAQALVDEFKRTLGLDTNRNSFAITHRVTERDPGEIVIQPRSLIGMMSFLSRGIDVPEAHSAQGRVVDMGSWEGLVPFRIRSSEEKPGNAFAAVRYQGHWFYIDHADHESKRAFNLIIYLFQLKAPETSAAAPILTLPTGP